ncbi:MAG: dihydroorotase [Halobacteriota archaeon]
MPIDTAITGGTVVTKNGQYEASVGVDDGKIVAVGTKSSIPDAEETVDASGQLVMPGTVDVHVHVADQFSEDSYETATGAAAVGGTTTYIDFAWQAWTGELSIFDEEGTLLEGVERKKEKGRDALIDFGLHGAITREDPEVLGEIPDVIEAGVPTFKMFTAYEIGLSNGFMNRVIKRLAEEDAVGVFHTEDNSVCSELVEECKAEGKSDATHFPTSRPDYSEAMAAEDAVRMATEAGMQYYGIHTSCRKSADVLEQFQDIYGSELVRAETCLHYTTLDESVYDEQGNRPVIQPPIRKPDDVEAMFEQLEDGVLSVVSTDHCAYTLDQKEGGAWWEINPGANALQTNLPVFYDEAVNRRGYDPSFVVEMLATNPAETFGMPQKGTLDPGTDADIVVFDPEKTYTVTAEDNVSVADYTIYEGREVTGKPIKTFVRGELIAEDGEVVGEPGHGEFLERELPDWD